MLRNVPTVTLPILMANVLLYYIIFLCACRNEEKRTNEAVADPITLTPLTDSILLNGVSMNYRQYGKGDITLVFVHGWNIDQSYWDHQLTTLESDYKVITVDLPGFGQSGKNRTAWTIERYGEDISTLIDQLSLKNIILIGHSMSGDVVLEAALLNEKVIGLIGVDTFKDVGMELTEEVLAEIEGFMDMLQTNYSQIVPAYAENTLFHSSTDTAVKVRVMSDFAHSDSAIATAVLISLFEYAEKEPQRLAALEQPLYLINSDATPTYTEGLDETGADYKIVDIHATGHYPMIEKPEEFNRLLKETINRMTN